MCWSSNAFLERKKYVLELPYQPNSNETMIPWKARPVKPKYKLMEHCQKKFKISWINNKVEKAVPLELFNFLCDKNVELERGVNLSYIIDLLINLWKWIRYPISSDSWQDSQCSHIFNIWNQDNGKFISSRKTDVKQPLVSNSDIMTGTFAF